MITFGKEYSKELESEVRATRRCLEAIPDKLYGWKPHEKSMNLGYLALLVADIPRWLVYALEKGEVNFATYEQFQLSTTHALLKHFDNNISKAKTLLEKVSNEDLEKPFHLKNADKVLYSQSRKDCVQSSINHWVHHRGQLTVYMRLNDIAVPLAWYGMSQWLNGFAYHITIDWTIFLIAFLSALIIAWLTVSFESIKAATTNPVNSLRSE